jgi:hypothetical protein
MPKEFLTIREAAEPGNLNRSPTWIRTAIKAGKIQAERIGPKLLILHKDEIARIQANPITISRAELGIKNEGKK